MRRNFARLILIGAVGLSPAAHAQSAGAPLQLSPGHQPATTAAPPAPVKVSGNWKVIAVRPDPLTGQSFRQVITLSKTNPVIHGKSVATALLMQCSRVVKGLQDPQLIVVFTSLRGIGHFKNFGARYRFDEGPVHDFTGQSVIGKDHARAIALPRMIDVSEIAGLPKLPSLESQVDPGIEIAGASRLRVEFDFRSAGVTFLDFNVSGATQAIDALRCP
jgi:hypothetical protein